VPSRGGSVAAFAFAALAPWAADAPAPELVVVREGAERALAVESARGFAAVALADLGAALGYPGGPTHVEVEGERVEFTVGSPFFRVGDRVYHLGFAPYRGAGGALRVPLRWAVEWLPAAAPGRWRYADGRLVGAPGGAVPVAERAARPRRPDRWVVVVDPGHGGADPGAIGPGGTREKDVALGIARELAALLAEHPRIRVVLTRDRDTLVALADRPRIANAAGGDLFISIHANALGRRSNVSGFETYFLAVAKTEDEARVAQMENAAARFERGAPAGVLDPVTFMLRDLVQNAYLIESLRWAETIQAELERALDAPNRGVKQAGFYVLVGANMPAVLVEVGYLTNPREEAVLRSSRHQRRVARALAAALESYLQQYGRRFWAADAAP
jgi:N-acetylmuramoyl-L-alanine amidase